ncbi:MAG: polysaccharide biosynthesis tyrosine autokinase [Acidobacteria bacterium]|nr:MAG: polysaccharide biosynthesis tyrosine autokinase [Acidobacteriota bacterium]
MDSNEITPINQTGNVERLNGHYLREEDVLDVLPEESPRLLDYWHVMLKRRWAVLTCLLIVFTTVAIGTFKQKPIYAGKILIEINPEEPQVLSFQQIAQAGPSWDLQSYRETQYQILKSRSLAERVVRDLRLYRYPEFYQSRSFLGLVAKDPEKIPSASDPNPPDPNSDAYLNSVTNFMRAVVVNPIERSNLVEVAFYSQDAAVAARVANQLGEDYIDQNLQVKWNEALKASEWLSGRLVELKAKLKASEDALQAYAAKNSILFIQNAVNAQAQSMANARLEQLEEEYTRAQADRAQKEAQYSLVHTGKVQDLPGVLDNRLIQTLEQNLSDLRRQYSELTATVKPGYPKAMALKKQIETLQANLDHQKQALTQNIAQQYDAAVVREKYLNSLVSQQESLVDVVSQKTIQYNILKREVDTNRSLYDGVLQRMKEAQVAAGLNASNIMVVDPAQVPKGPAKPRVILNLAVGFILGLSLGVGLAFLQEYLDNTLKTPDEVEFLLRLPSLGLIPSVHLNGSSKSLEHGITAIGKGSNGLYGLALQKDPTAVEAFRSLRTSILLSAHPVPKVLLVTSALPGEGKTTTTVNLGATLASLGSKVLILDCDMRRPACHRATGVRNSPGFVQCLTRRVQLSEAILPVNGIPNLSIIPCGPVPPNPAEVLSSPLTVELLKRLHTEFEYVLVDSPPILSVADSRILATITDAVVLVTRACETPYDIVRRARALLYGAGARILGVALNEVQIHRSNYGGKYGYYQQYGYGYGNNHEANGPEA